MDKHSLGRWILLQVILCFQLMRCGFYLLEFYGNEAYNLLTNWLAFKTFSYCTFFYQKHWCANLYVYGSRCAPSLKGCQRRRGWTKEKEVSGERCSEFALGSKIHTQMKKWHSLVESSMSSLSMLSEISNIYH